VSSAIGFVALFGIAAMDGILVLSYFICAWISDTIRPAPCCKPAALSCGR
jgi:Cu/Ag efflux pump CusA